MAYVAKGKPGRKRWLRQLAHERFDRIWKHGVMSRSAAYRWLAEQMGITAASRLERKRLASKLDGLCESLLMFHDALLK